MPEALIVCNRKVVPKQTIQPSFFVTTMKDHATEDVLMICLDCSRKRKKER